MTFLRASLGLLLCGCTPCDPSTVTVPSAIPHAQDSVALPELVGDFGCGVFAKDGISESSSAFRACVERAVAAQTPCEGGSSPDLVTLELAVVLVDGTGGPTDIPRARKLLETCFEDISVQTVIEHADAKERYPHTRPFEKCDEYAQTTLGITECLHEHLDNERAWVDRESRAYEARTRPVFDRAAQVAETWARDLGAIEYARYEDGTMRDPAMIATMYDAMKDRRARLATIRTWEPSAPVSTDGTLRDELANALKLIENSAEPEEKRALHEEEDVWAEYRDAEAELYAALHPGTRADATIELLREHVNDMRALVQDP